MNIDGRRPSANALFMDPEQALRAFRDDNIDRVALIVI
jgi:hypothetical protein